MAIERPGAPPLHVCVRPLTANGRPMAALYVIDPLQHARLDEQLLRRAYLLSRAEIRVVNELLQGQSVEGVAEALNVSVHTIRTHLKNIFAKTGTCRQAELVRLMSSCLGGLRVERSGDAPPNPPPESSDIFRPHDQQSRRFRG
jgi:DNA-binding CsgD family transcriptional regulator